MEEGSVEVSIACAVKALVVIALFAVALALFGAPEKEQPNVLVCRTMVFFIVSFVLFIGIIMFDGHTPGSDTRPMNAVSWACFAVWFVVLTVLVAPRATILLFGTMYI